MADTRPNVLFIGVSDLNHWVGYLGRNLQARTPNIDRLASRGVWFKHSYCPAPVCNASRAALMSGLRPSTSGVYENHSDWRSVIDDDLTLTTTFRRAGYHVCGAGIIYHEIYRRQSEWDDYLADPGKDATPGNVAAVGDIRFGPVDCGDEDMRDWRVVNYAIGQLQKKRDKPFFLGVGFYKPHLPWCVPRKYYDLHPLADIQLPPYREDDLDDIPAAGVAMTKKYGDHAPMLASGRWKEAIQGYLAAISFSDAQLGRLLDALDASPHRDNTIICLWSDHGWHLGEKHHWRKFALWEEATRVPLIWIVPDVTRSNARCDSAVDLMCVYPTLVDLCGIAKPPHVEGPSIRALLADPSARWDEPAISTYLYMNHAVRTERWRYIRYADGSEELYDEIADPYEWTNLAGNPAYAPRKAELSKFLPGNNHPDVGGS